MKTIAALQRQITLLAILLTLQLAVGGAFLSFHIQSRRESQVRRERATKMLKDLEDERQKVFKEYADALESYETKSVMHQIYHAQNANLRLQNIGSQQQQLLILFTAEE